MDRQKKRKTPDTELLGKPWKSRVLVQNKTVKKSDTITRRVVWFSGLPLDELSHHIVNLTGRIVSPDPIKARQCMDFEVHFKTNVPLPSSMKFMVLAVLYRADTGEEIKEGVVNNFSYVQTSNLHAIAVFQKLYIETRSQYNHFLEFTLWGEKLGVPTSCEELGKHYDKETYFPLQGTNTYRTAQFIPSLPSSKSNMSHEETEGQQFRFLKIFPSSGEPNQTIYLTFETKTKETGGEIFIVWNDTLIHLPFYTKGGNQRVIVLEKVPPPPIRENDSRQLPIAVPVYLKEKPPQDSRQIGNVTNVLYFEYSTDPNRPPSLSMMDSQPQQNIFPLKETVGLSGSRSEEDGPHKRSQNFPPLSMQSQLHLPNVDDECLTDEDHSQYLWNNSQRERNSHEYSRSTPLSMSSGGPGMSSGRPSYSSDSTLSYDSDSYSHRLRQQQQNQQQISNLPPGSSSNYFPGNNKNSSGERGQQFLNPQNFMISTDVPQYNAWTHPDLGPPNVINQPNIAPRGPQNPNPTNFFHSLGS